MKLPATKHLTVRVDLKQHQEFGGSLLEDAKIDQNDIDNELADHPSRAAWWNALAELGSVAVDRAYEHWKDRLAQAELEARDSYVSSGKKAPAEKVLECRARLDPDVQASREAYFRAKEAYAQLKAGQRVFDHRKDALMALARRQTSEYASSILDVKETLKENPDEARERRIAKASHLRQRRRSA